MYREMGRKWAEGEEWREKESERICEQNASTSHPLHLGYSRLAHHSSPFPSPCHHLANICSDDRVRPFPFPFPLAYDWIQLKYAISASLRPVQKRPGGGSGGEAARKKENEAELLPVVAVCQCKCSHSLSMPVVYIKMYFKILLNNRRNDSAREGSQMERENINKCKIK